MKQKLKDGDSAGREELQAEIPCVSKLIDQVPFLSRVAGLTIGSASKKSPGRSSSC